MPNRGKVILAGIALGLILLSRKARAVSKKTLSVNVGPVKRDIQLSTHFKLSEFLRSKYAPALADYTPSQEEMARLRRHIKQLETVRDRFGRVVITSGGRPNAVSATSPKTGATTTITQAMIDGGDDAVFGSDHIVFAASDFVLPDASLVGWREAYDILARDPNTRQVILYTVRDDGGKIAPDHFHLSTVQDGMPPLPQPNRAFAKLDGAIVTANV